MGQTFTSLDTPDKLNTGMPSLPEYATRSGLQVQQGAMVLESLRRDAPGSWAADRWLQSQKNVGPIYLATNAILSAMGGIVASVERKVKHTNKTTFIGDKTIRKALPPNAYGKDHEYIPAEESFPACEMLEHPNERGDTFPDVFRYMILQELLTGVAPLWCVPNWNHQPVEIYALPSAMLQPNLTVSMQYPNGAYTFLPYYTNGTAAYLPGGYAGVGAVIPADELPRKKRPHPFLLWDGYSPLTAGAIELDILQAIDQCWWTMMDEGVILDTVFMLPGQDTNQIARFESSVKHRHGGARNARRFFALGGGEAGAKYDVKQLSPAVRDMDFPDGRSTMLDYCLALFGVPKDMVLSDTESSYSRLYASIQRFQLLTLQPMATDYARFFSRHLCDPWTAKPGEYRVKLEVPQMKNPELDQSQQKIDINIVSVNDRLAAQNRPPVEFGEYPEPVYLAKLQEKAMPQPIMPQLPVDGPNRRIDDAAKKEDATVAPSFPPEAERPENKAGEGSLGPRMKAMSSINQGNGGALVGPKKRKVLRGKRAQMALAGLVCKAVGKR